MPDHDPALPRGATEEPSSIASEEIVHRHVTLHWHAEMESAKRLSVKGTALQTLLSALLGISLLSSGGLSRAAARIPSIAYATIQVFLVLSAIVFLAALGVLLLRADEAEARRKASAHLRWPESADLNPSLMTEWGTARVSRQLVQDAANDLALRNSRDATRLVRSQLGIYLATSAAVLAGVLYVVSDRAPATPLPAAPELPADR